MDKAGIVFGICVVLILLVATLTGVHRFYQIENELEDCKDRGFDGIKFVSKFNTETKCSNFKDNECIKSKSNETRSKDGN